MLNALFRAQSIFPTRAIVILLAGLLCGFSSASTAASSSENENSLGQGSPKQTMPPIEFRGFLSFGNRTSFSLRDLETGSSWWMHLGQERFGVRLEQFNQEEMEIIVSWQGQRTSISLKEFLNEGGMAVVSSIQLSPIVQEVYDLSEKLIKTARSKESGRLVRDQRKVEQLRSFLAQNPSVAEIHDFLPELGDALDYEEFLKIEFPPVMKGRNKQNTPRWGVDKSLDLADIEQLIASNPSASQLESALSQK